MSEKSKEWKLPKNVRQIGDGGGDRKIYVEDYVTTFLESLCGSGKQKKAILFGTVREQEEYSYVFVEGAMEVSTFSPDGLARDELQVQMGKYFGGKRVVGWFLSSEESPFVMDQEITEIFCREFSGENQVLIVRDVQEKENLFFLMEGEEPVRQPGYYIYFEKNTAMQEYMISRSNGRSVEKEEPVKDDAIRRFRKIIQEKKKIPQIVPGKLVYLASGLLAVTVLALGVTMVYNYDKMKEVERSLARLTNNVDSQSQYLDGGEDTAPVMLHIEDGLDMQESVETAKTDVVSEETPVSEGIQSGAEEAAANAAENGTPENAADETAENGTADSGNTQNGDAPETAAQTSGTPQTEGQETENAVTTTAAARASYTVKVGDTLAAISEMYYGTIDRVTEICSMNGIDDENTILPGQKILLP